MSENTFDLSKYETAETGILEVLNEKDEPLIGPNGQPVTIEMYGPGSEVAIKAQAKVDQATTARTFAAVRGKLPKDAAGENRKLQAEKLAACTKAINNFPVDPLALYSNPRLGYITAQVAKFQDDWSNFPAASTTT